VKIAETRSALYHHQTDMSRIHVTAVRILDDPKKCSFNNNLRFQICFNCINPGVEDELEWKVVYVGSADDESQDQILDTCLVGPCSVGKNRFVLQVPSPEVEKIPKKDLFGVTVLLICCSYRNQEFIRIGYYVKVEHPDVKVSVETVEEIEKGGAEKEDKGEDGEEEEEQEQEGDGEPDVINQKFDIPDNLDYKFVTREVLDDQPRITRFNIKWDETEEAPENPQQESQVGEKRKFDEAIQS